MRYWVRGVGGVIAMGEKPKSWDRLVSVQLCPPLVAHALAWFRTQASGLRHDEGLSSSCKRHLNPWRLKSTQNVLKNVCSDSYKTSSYPLQWPDNWYCLGELNVKFPHRTPWSYVGRLEVWLHSFLTSALDGGELSPSCLGSFTSRHQGPDLLLWRVGNIFRFSREPNPMSSSP